MHGASLTPQKSGDEKKLKKYGQYGQARGEKSKKCEGGVFHRQDWSQFNPLAKRNSFCKTNICEKHPLIGENCIQSLKNMDFAHFHSFYKGSLRQKSLK